MQRHAYCRAGGGRKSRITTKVASACQAGRVVTAATRIRRVNVAFSRRRQTWGGRYLAGNVHVNGVEFAQNRWSVTWNGQS